MTHVTRILHNLRALALLAAAAPVAHAAAPDAHAPAKPRRGEILQVDKDSITAMPYLPPRASERGGPVTYKLDENTQIYTSHLVDATTTPDGRPRRTYKTERATRDDLKVGLLARIEADGDRAIRIVLMPDDLPPPKKPE